MAKRISLDFDADGIAPQLLQWPHFVCWDVEMRRNKSGQLTPTKVPINPSNGRRARPNDATTWVRFDVAVKAARRAGRGLGFVFAEDPFTGIDLDGCRDPRTGALAPWAANIVRAMRSYTEVSPSGTGVKVFVAATLADCDGRRKGPIELYSARRFFCLTGRGLADTPPTVQPRPAQLAALVARLFPPEQPRRPEARAAGPIRVESGRFRRLMAGDWQGLGFGSQSEADLALCGYLARATGGNPAEINAQFRASGLMRPKWERNDYRERTINRALG